MKKALLMISLTVFARLLVAQELDVQSLVGEYWYGLYLKGQKAGYAVNSVTVGDDEAVTISEDAVFQVTMMGVRQDMRIRSSRIYASTGELRSIESVIDDPTGKTTFQATVTGDVMAFRKTLAGETTEQELPRPKESLQDALNRHHLVGEHAKVGDELAFSVFEPLYIRELTGRSRIAGSEERVFDGVPMKVFRVNTILDSIGIESVSYVGEDGTVFEDTVSGFITMRLEPEEMAKDVNYNNDVIVSNAALVKTPIANPRTRAELKLHLRGPLTPAHFFNDERQEIKVGKDGFDFIGRRLSLEGFAPAQLPIQDEKVQKWMAPSLLVQSDNPRLVAKAEEIVGDETDALAISNKLCEWVSDNVRTTFSAQLTNALEVLGSMEGDCTEHSILFIGLARAAGLPAREAAGLVYVEGPQPGFYFHQWATVWVGKWIDVDPTLDQPVADATHIKLATGDLYEQARLIPIIGQLEIEVVEDSADLSGDTSGDTSAEEPESPAE